MKILSGFWKNTPFYFNSNLKVKPTSTIIRNILFNWLEFDISSKSCLDLFSGLGTLGFEAASRGCKSTLVEKNKNIFNCLVDFKKRVKANNILLYNMNSEIYINKYKYIKYDLIFIDPPYKNFKNLYFFINNCLDLVKRNSFIFIESNLNLFLVKNYFKNYLKIKNYNFFGKKNYFLFKII